MSAPRPEAPNGLTPPVPTEAGEVASAGRSCLAIVLIAVALLLLLCVGSAVRWAMG